MSLGSPNQEFWFSLGLAWFFCAGGLALLAGRGTRSSPFPWWSAAAAAEALRFFLAASPWHLNPGWFWFPAASLQATAAGLFLAGARHHLGRPPREGLALAAGAAIWLWGAGAALAPFPGQWSQLPLAAAAVGALAFAAGEFWVRARDGRGPAYGWAFGVFAAWAGVRAGAAVFPGAAFSQMLEPPLSLAAAAATAGVFAVRFYGHRRLSAKLEPPHPSGRDHYFDEILEAIPTAAVVTDINDGVVLFANQRSGALFGVAAETLVGRRDLEFFQEPGELKRIARQVRRNRALWEKEAALKKGDGTPFMAKLSVWPAIYRGREAALTGLYDITELKNAEAEARTAAAQLRMVLAHAPVIINTINRDGVFTFSEGKALEKVDLKPGEVVGQSAFEFFAASPDRVALLRRAFAGEAFAAEVEVNGEFFDAAHQPIFDEKGEVVELVTVGTHITARKKAQEEALRLAAAVEQTADLVLIMNPDGRIAYANPAFTRVSGYSREEAIGRNTRFLKSAGCDDDFFLSLGEQLRAGETWRGHFSNHRKDGAFFEVDCTITPLRDEMGKVVSFVSVEKDVTEHHRLEAKLRQAQRLEMVGTMAGALAHDFNNLLLPIIGYAQLLQARWGDESQDGRDLALILSGATRAKELLNQLLTFARQRTREREPVRLEPLVEEVLTFLQPSVGKKIQIEKTFPIAPAVVFSDPDLVHRVLTNVCLNAVQAMPKGGTLRVGLAPVSLTEGVDYQGVGFSGDFIRVRVEDTGLGMNQETQNQIFEPFFTTKGTGTGLGLATVLRILQLTGGHMALESAPGQGTRFDIYFRRYAGQEDAPEPQPEAATGGGGSILYVDDEEAIVALAQRSLGGLGYEVTGETDSRRALGLFKDQPARFDLVVTDLHMPALPGQELAQAVRKIRPDVPIMLCSAYTDKINPATAHDIGFCTLLQKPFTLQELAREVKTALESRARSQAAENRVLPSP